MPDRDPNEHTEKVRRKALKSISCHYERPHHHVWRGAAQVSLAVVILMAITHSDHKSQYKHVSSAFGGKWRRRKEIDVASPTPPHPPPPTRTLPHPAFSVLPTLETKMSCRLFGCRQNCLKCSVRTKSELSTSRIFRLFHSEN